MVITPGKNFPGQKGFPTPSDVPSDTACRSFILPDNDEWFGLLMGAVELLLNPHNYYNYGALSIDDTVDAWQLIVQDALERSLLGTCDPSVPAPWWDEDSADDADDEEAALTQTWYGEIVAESGLLVAEDAGLTFLDNLGIWAIAGFIAYAGQPGAAIAFIPVAQRFVLSFKQHSLGGVVRALVDFLEVAEIDTYGATDGVANLSIVMPDDGMPHTLYVELTDANPHGLESTNVQVIRRRLSSNDVTPDNLRWNSECDCVQQTPDGGSTWIDSPGQDPRRAAGFQLPPRGGADPQCDSAANMVAKLKSMVNIFEAEIAQLQAANALLDIVLVFLPEVGIVLAALLAITEFLLTIGADAISSAFTDEQWNLVEQAIYCNLNNDGSMSQNGFESALSRINQDCDPVVYDVLFNLMPGIGWVGLSNAGATGDLTGSCGSFACNWCYAYLWQECEPDSWSTVSGFINTLRCDETPHFWQGGGTPEPASLGISATVGDGEGNTHITGFTLEWAIDDAVGNQDQVVRMYDHSGGTLLYAWNSGITDGGSTGGSQTVHITGLDLHVGVVALVGYARDYCIAFNFQLEGDGYRPFPATNC